MGGVYPQLWTSSVRARSCGGLNPGIRVDSGQRDPNEQVVCLVDWLGNRALRNFFLRFSEALWVDVARSLCLLGVLCLRHLAASPDAVWCSSSDLADLVDYIQREDKWPEALTPRAPRRGQEWAAPWREARAFFPKPSPEWRVGGESSKTAGSGRRAFSLASTRTVHTCSQPSFWQAGTSDAPHDDGIRRIESGRGVCSKGGDTYKVHVGLRSCDFERNPSYGSSGSIQKSSTLRSPRNTPRRDARVVRHKGALHEPHVVPLPQRSLDVSMIGPSQAYLSSPSKPALGGSRNLDEPVVSTSERVSRMTPSPSPIPTPGPMTTRDVDKTTPRDATKLFLARFDLTLPQKGETAAQGIGSVSLFHGGLPSAPAASRFGEVELEKHVIPSNVDVESLTGMPWWADLSNPLDDPHVATELTRADNASQSGSILLGCPISPLNKGRGAQGAEHSHTPLCGAVDGASCSQRPSGIRNPSEQCSELCASRLARGGWAADVLLTSKKPALNVLVRSTSTPLLGRLTVAGTQPSVARLPSASESPEISPRSPGSPASTLSSRLSLGAPWTC